MKVSDFLESIVAYPDFSPIQRIDASNNTTAICLDSIQMTGRNALDTEKIASSFRQTGLQIVSLYNEARNLSEDVDGFSLEELVAFIAKDILPALAESTDFPDRDRIVLGVTTYLNMFAAALRDTNIAAESDLDLNDFQATLRELIEAEFDILRVYFERVEVVTDRDSIETRDEFGAVFCELLIAVMEVSDIQTARWIGETLQNMSKELKSNRTLEKTSAKLAELQGRVMRELQRTSKLLSTVENVLTSRDDIALKNLKEFFSDPKIGVQEKVTFTNIFRTLFHPFIARLTDQYDRGTSIHSENVGNSHRCYALDIAAIAGEDNLASQGESGEELAVELANTLGITPEQLRKEILDY